MWKQAATATNPPLICYNNNPGYVQYDRHNACESDATPVTISGASPGSAVMLSVTWLTLAPNSRSWTVHTLATLTQASGALLTTVVTAHLNVVCSNGNCGTQSTVSQDLVLNKPVEFDFDGGSTGTAITYPNPQVQGNLEIKTAVPIQTAVVLNTPFAGRCDSESYIGNSGGCVYYSGYYAIPTYYLDYTGPVNEVAANALYDEVVRDTAHHYGDIAYGNPLTRGTDADIALNRGVACPSSTTSKAPANTSCDEYPYANTQQGAAYNSAYSCAFVTTVPIDQNTLQGQDLNTNFYVPDRILRPTASPKGDPYWVWVTNAPTTVPPVRQCSTY
jgi:hypothetical protein